MNTISSSAILERKIPRIAAGRLIGEVAESSRQNANKLLLACADLPENEANVIRAAWDRLTTMSAILRKISQLRHHE
jgi:hypothetical protein